MLRRGSHCSDPDYTIVYSRGRYCLDALFVSWVGLIYVSFGITVYSTWGGVILLLDKISEIVYNEYSRIDTSYRKGDTRKMNKLDHDLFSAGPGGQMEVTWRNIAGYLIVGAVLVGAAFICPAVLSLTYIAP